jgi:hypothetical protein
MGAKLRGGGGPFQGVCLSPVNIRRVLVRIVPICDHLLPLALALFELSFGDLRWQGLWVERDRCAQIKRSSGDQSENGPLTAFNRPMASLQKLRVLFENAQSFPF